MVDSMDIAFVLVNISSTRSFFPKIRRMIQSIVCLLNKNQYDIRVALIKVPSGNGSLTPLVHSFTRSFDDFYDLLATDHGPAGQHAGDGTIPICNALQEALNLDWRTGSSDRCHENVVFMITDDVPCRHLVNPTETLHDGCPCACDDLWEISHTFLNKNLTLVIVGAGQLVGVCDRLYGAVAQNTGGEYIPLTNATRVLFLALRSVVTQGYTLPQSFRHIKEEEYEKNTSYHCSIIPEQDQFENKHCPMMAQKGAWVLNHRLST